MKNTKHADTKTTAFCVCLPFGQFERHL